MIYIFKDDQRSGPYEDHVILDQLKAALLSPDDMAVRHGETEWKTLRSMFPAATAAAVPPPQQHAAAYVAAGVGTGPQYRNTLIPKVFFAICFVGALLGFAAAVFYVYSLSGSSGSLDVDLSRMAYRILGRNLAIGMFVGGFFTLLAFLLAFKRKLIASNGARIGLRVVFILILLAGLGNFLFGAVSYFIYSPPYRSVTSQKNELLEALEEGEAAVGPYEMAVIVMPIGAGLVLLGLSGVLMAKRPRD